MDSSQYIRQKQEAANVYVSRMKTVDSSFLTMQRQQRAASAGYADIQAIPYFNGANVLNPILYDVSSCPIKRAYTQGYTATNRLSQHEDLASRRAGCVICASPDYSVISPGVTRLNCTEASTILTQYNSLAPVPGEWKAYGYGQNYYFPSGDRNSDCGTCDTNKTVFPSG